MALFGRRERFQRRAPQTSTARIEGFWQWWQEKGRHLAERSITGDLDPAEFAEGMTRSVQAMGDLVWELAPGTSSAHLLVISPEAAVPKRALARRVLMAAPPADETWAYADARQPAEDPEKIVLRADGAGEVAFAEVRVAARMQGNRFDVVIHHPSFADLAPASRSTVAFLALDAALGEVDTEVWIGEVTPSELAPLDGFGLNALRAVVAQHTAGLVDADGERAWVMLEGQSPAGPLLASAQVPLHPSYWPNLEQHVAVALPYPANPETGLPLPDSLEQLRAAEDMISERLGAGGQLVAHQTSAGVRVLHLYVDPQAHLLDGVREVVRAWPHKGASVDAMEDPGWLSVQHLRT